MEWRDIEGFPGYQVSNTGRVRSLDRWLNGKFCKGRERKLTTKRSGHKSLRIWKDGRRVDVKVHRAVLGAFVGPPPDGMEACHNDGDPANNNLSNLRWDTRSENTKDLVRHGRHYFSNKTHCPQGHPYSQENTFRQRGGGRRCRACERQRNQRRWAARRKIRAA